MKQYLIFDIGGTNLKFALFNQDNEIIQKAKEPTATNLSSFIMQIKKICDRFPNQFSGLGFSVPGKADVEHQIIHFGGALTFIDGLNFRKEFGDFYHVPVAIENDGKAAALAEHWKGNLHGINNGAILVLGTGVGGGLILNGQLFRGSHFQAGEVSVMNADHETLYGSAGSAVNMIKHINKLITQTDLANGQKAFAQINAGDPAACQIFKEYCHQIAKLILNIQSVIDLEKYVIGGGISAQPIVTQTINQEYDALFEKEEMQWVKAMLTRPQIETASMGNQANLYGALDNLLNLITQ